MRAAFVQTLVELAERDPRVLLLTGDLGFWALEPFANRFPKRFFNVGVAEQNMVGLATGLAEAGFIPFVYSIVTFATLRPYEFIRNGPILHRLRVRVAGVGGGFEYAHNGLTHYGLEDVGVMRVQPGMTVLAPADPEQARSAVLAAWDLPGPVYFRLGKDDKTRVPGLEGRFAMDRVEVIREGTDAAFFALGPVATDALVAAELLEKRGVSCAVMVVPCLNPPPVESLVGLLSRFPLVLAVEAHYLVGGLGSLLCETVAEQRLPCRVVRCGVASTPSGITGCQSWMHSVNGLSGEALAERALHELEKPG